MEFVFEEGKQQIDQCSTLIMPALSTGNVGQLAIDLLVSSMEAERIGYLDDPFVLPCVGNDAYGSTPNGILALPLEAYVSLHNSLTLIQQRSPVIKGMMIEFAKHVAEFAATNGREHIIVLSSLNSGRKSKVDDSRETYYISSSTDDGRDDHCEKLGWKRLPEYNPAQRHWAYLHALAEANSSPEESPFSEDEISDEAYCPSLPFAALFSCCKAKGLKVTCILCYCTEGDNIPDSFHLAEAACMLLGLDLNNFLALMAPSPCCLEILSPLVSLLNPSAVCRNRKDRIGWRIPFSWNSLYGPPPDTLMF